jgi:hypothetical protein
MPYMVAATTVGYVNKINGSHSCGQSYAVEIVGYIPKTSGYKELANWWQVAYECSFVYKVHKVQLNFNCPITCNTPEYRCINTP